MKRVANDAQIERLLSALKRPDGRPGLSDYGKTLAIKIASRDNIKIESAQRRLQRYITDAGERRVIYRAPIEIRRSLRTVARATPLPKPLPRPVVERPVIERATFDEYDDEDEDEDQDFDEPLRRDDPEVERAPARELLPRYETDTTSNYEIQAVIAYFDGDTREAGRALGVDSRVLDLVSQGTEITRHEGKAQIDAGIERLYGSLDERDVNEIQDFADVLHDWPDWRIGLILDDLASGNTTFAEWVEAYYNDLDRDVDQDTSEFWALWRAAYARAKK